MQTDDTYTLDIIKKTKMKTIIITHSHDVDKVSRFKDDNEGNNNKWLYK